MRRRVVFTMGLAIVLVLSVGISAGAVVVLGQDEEFYRIQFSDELVSFLADHDIEDPFDDFKLIKLNKICGNCDDNAELNRLILQELQVARREGYEKVYTILGNVRWTLQLSE